MILIVGPTGNTGAPALSRLLEMGQSVRVLVRSEESAAKLPVSDKLEVVRGDLDDPQSLIGALQGVQKVFFTTAFSPQMAQQTRNLVAAAVANNIQQLVLLSGVGADKTSSDSVLRWLGEMEQAVKDSNIAYTMLRGGSFMQNFLANAESIREESKVYASAKTTTFTLVDACDIGKVAAAVLVSDKHHNCTYDITGSEILTYQEITKVFATVLGREINYVYLPLSVMEENLLSAGLPKDFVDPLIELWRDLEEIPLMFPLSNAVKELTGDDPVTFKQFVMDNKNLLV